MFKHGVVHQVKAGKVKTDSFRLFTGFRITKETTPLFSNLDMVCEENNVPFLPSGQLPAMYSTIHTNTQIPRLFNLSVPMKRGDPRKYGKKFVRKMRCVKNYKGHAYYLPGCGESINLPHGYMKFLERSRSMIGLKQAGLPKYEYTSETRNCMKPQPF
jgi:hypothetical protein